MRKLPSVRLWLVIVTGALALVTSGVGALAAPPSDRFSDDNDSVHEADIEFLARRDITKGCNPPDNTRYCPDRPVTRGEMAAYLVRSIGLPRGRDVAFVDATSSIFADDIARIARGGITKGCNPPNNDRFCPNDHVTRGQMAAFLIRAFDLPSTSNDYFTDDSGSVFEADINAIAHAGVTVGCDDGRFCADESVTRAQMASFLKRALTGGIEPPPIPDEGENGTEPPAATSTLPPPGDTAPAGAVHVDPGESLAQAVSQRPAGTTFYLTAGVHRLNKVRPKDNQTFVGAPGAVLSGARVLDGFAQSGSLWSVGGQSQENERKGVCVDGYTGCVYPEQLFIDGRELWQVTSKTQVEPGTWYLDYGTDTIWIGDNPSGHTVEASVVPVAFDGPAHNVTIRDLTIEKYATPGQMGTIHGQTDRNGTYGNGWKVIGNEIRYNASEGVVLGHNMVVQANFIHHNGRTGVGSGLAENGSILDNEISYNCRGTGYLCSGWGGGGVKLAGADGTVMRGNYVHHNSGVGLHSDVQSTDTAFDANTVVDNDGAGIFVEVSTGATVTGNRVLDNGFRRPEGRGAGILVSSSSGVTITGNDVIDNALGIVAIEHGRPPGLDDIVVTNNHITMDTTGYSGLRLDSGGGVGAVTTWDHNVYELPSSSRAFIHVADLLSVDQWQLQGHDTSSSFR